MIDNVHFCTMQQIMERVEDDPKEVSRKQRNLRVKEKAKQVIVHEEKRLYKDKY